MSWWPTGIAVAVFAAGFAQAAFGEAGMLAVHVPLAMLLLVGAVVRHGVVLRATAALIRPGGRVRGRQVDRMSDDLLLAGLTAGDAELSVAFVRRFQGPVFGVALTVLGDPTLAEDVAQQAFERAWRHAALFDPRRGAVQPWLTAITHNLAVDAARARRAIPVDPLELEDVLTGDTPEGSAIAAESADELRAAIRALPAEQGRALVLAAFRGMTAREVAESEGIPLGTAKTRIRAAMLRLAATLEEAGGPVMTASDSAECGRFRELAPEIALGLVAGHERAEALAHLQDCPACRQHIADARRGARPVAGAHPARRAARRLRATGAGTARRHPDAAPRADVPLDPGGGGRRGGRHRVRRRMGGGVRGPVAAPAVASPLVDGAQHVGDVVVSRDRPNFLSVYLDVARPGRLTCELLRTDGSVAATETYDATGGTGWWGISRPAGDVATIRVSDAGGAVVAVGGLPRPCPWQRRIASTAPIERPPP